MMKNRYVLFLCFALCATLTSFAQTFTVDGLTYTVTSTSPNEVTLTGGTPPTSDLIIPDVVNDGINDFTVVALGNNAFESAGLTSVSFPNTIRALGQITFRSNSLTTVTIPEGITDIPQRCFSNNDLVSVTLPESLEFIRFRAFENNPLTTITFPENVTSITSLAFLNNPLNAITSLNTTPPSIQGDTFTNRQNIDLTVPDTTEDAYATAGWTSFKTVNGEIPLQVGSIFEVDGLAFEIISLTPNEVRAAGGSAIPTNLVLPETVSFQEELFTLVALGNSAFESAGLTSVSFPNTLRALGQVTFRFNSLTIVTIPEGITDIPQRCFSSNDLTSVTLPNSIETIGFRSFENNPLTTITFPENVTSIASLSFRNNPLNTVASLNPIPPSIQGDTFTNRQNIDLTIPDTTEDAYATAGWVGFNSVNGVVDFEVGDTFTENNFNYTVTSLSPNEVSVTGGNSVPQNLNINETVSNGGSDFAVTAVGSSAFISNGLTSVSLPNTITTIEGQAFRNNQLTSITIPENVSLVAFRAFQGNPLFAVTALGSTPANITTDVTIDSFGNRGDIDLTIPTGTQLDYLNSGWTGFATINGELPLDVGNTVEVNGLSYTVTALNPTEVEAAGGTSIPTNLVLPETVTIQEIVFTVIGVGDGAFTSSGLTSVTFPTTIRTIGSLAFRFNALTSVVIPEGVTDLPNRCFASNDLTSVTFPTSLETIGFRAFESNNLTSLLLPENLVSIGQLAFGGSINSINSLNPTPPSVVLGTGDDSFTNENDIDLTVPNGTEAAYEAAGWLGFNSVNGVINFEVGDTFVVNNLNYTVTSVAPNEVTLTGGTAVPQDLVIDAIVSSGGSDFMVTAIGNSAFQDLGLTNVTLPNTLRNIDSRAFNNNPLTTVTVNATIPPSVVTGTNDSFGNRDTIDVTVPDGTEDAYLIAEWTGFRSINGDVAVGQILTVGDLQYEVTSSNPNTVKVLNRVTTSQNILIPETVADPNTTTLFDVTVVDNEAFADTDITIVTIGSRIQTIGANAFNTTTLTQIEALGTIPATIEENSFGTRENIVLLIPENTETDYENAGWTGFFSVNGEGVAIGNTFSIGGIRYSILSLSPNTVSAIDRSGSIPNNDFIFPEVLSIGGIDFSITTIGNSAFRSENVNSVHFPSTLTTFEFRAFRDNGNLTTVTFPENVTTIGTEAFLNNGLTEVISNALVPPTISNSSFGSRSGIDLFVPEGTEQAYLDAGWTGFASVTEFTIDITVAPKVFLQGASLNPITGEEDLMRDSLRENGLLPTISPYGDGATVDPTVFTTTGANAIVDWVLVELRTGADNENTTVVNSTSAFLQRDGDVVDVDGISTITFTEEEGDYFIAIKHRNHIGVLAAVPAALSNTASSLDFTQDAAFAKGENLALTTLVNGTFAMIAGDADGSSQILNTDITEGLTLAGGGEGYSNADADMNGFVLNSDIQLLILGNSGTVQQFN